MRLYDFSIRFAIDEGFEPVAVIPADFVVLHLHYLTPDLLACNTHSEDQVDPFLRADQLSHECFGFL